MYGLCNRLLYPSLRLLCYTCGRMQLLLVVLYPAAAPDADGTAGAVGAALTMNVGSPMFSQPRVCWPRKEIDEIATFHLRSICLAISHHVYVNNCR